MSMMFKGGVLRGSLAKAYKRVRGGRSGKIIREKQNCDAPHLDPLSSDPQIQLLLRVAFESSLNPVAIHDCFARAL